MQLIKCVFGPSVLRTSYDSGPTVRLNSDSGPSVGPHTWSIILIRPLWQFVQNQNWVTITFGPKSQLDLSTLGPQAQLVHCRDQLKIKTNWVKDQLSFKTKWGPPLRGISKKSQAFCQIYFRPIRFQWTVWETYLSAPSSSIRLLSSLSSSMWEANFSRSKKLSRAALSC